MAKGRTLSWGVQLASLRSIKLGSGVRRIGQRNMTSISQKGRRKATTTMGHQFGHGTAVFDTSVECEDRASLGRIPASRRDCISTKQLQFWSCYNNSKPSGAHFTTSSALTKWPTYFQPMRLEWYVSILPHLVCIVYQQSLQQWRTGFPSFSWEGHIRSNGFEDWYI